MNAEEKFDQDSTDRPLEQELRRWKPVAPPFSATDILASVEQETTTPASTQPPSRWSMAIASWSCGLAVGIRFCLHGLQECVQRGFDVHHHLAVIGQMNNQIGANGARFGDGVDLLLEVTVLDHPGQLHDPAKRNLPPLATHFGAPQCLHQALGFLPQIVLIAGHGFELGADAAE